MMVDTWLFQNLQKWTPFSVMALLVVGMCLGIITWDTTTGKVIPDFIFTILSIIIGGTGATAAVSHGVIVANGVASGTAKAVIEQAVKAGGIVPPTEETK